MYLLDQKLTIFQSYDHFDTYDTLKRIYNIFFLVIFNNKFLIRKIS